MKKATYLFFIFFSICVCSQTLSSTLSKSKIQLGEKAIFEIKINHLQGKDVVASPRNELLPFHFEESKDEIKKTFDTYSRVIEFSIYEEGKFTIPALEISIGGEIKQTIPYEIEVYNPANSTDQINDIMNNKQVDLGWKDYWELYQLYILGVLALLVSVFLVYLFSKKGFFKKMKKAKTPTHQTLIDLENLKKKKYIESGNYRMFYVELIDIARGFLTRQYQIPADVLLTDDLVDLMKKRNSISRENEEIIEEVFLRGDLVKFAKTIPTSELMEKDFSNIFDFVKRSYKDIEVEKLRENV
ncbi:MAG: hypothetical protein KBA33_07840 [Cloacibacterium sp.]|nr:hypothetical protein [Cloacibacterium sp.]